MRQSNSIIRATKWALHDRLATDPFFANIPGYVRIPKTVQTQIAEKAYPVKGCCFLIGAMHLPVADTGTPGPYFNEGSVVIEVIENVKLNANTGLPDCDETAERAMELFSPFMIEDALCGQRSTTVSGWSEDELDDYSIRRFMVNLPMGFEPVVMPAMPPIVVTPNGAVNGVYPMAVSLNLQAPLPGATIFYTLDGSFPAPRNPAAQMVYQDTSNILSNPDGTMMVNPDGTPVYQPAGPLNFPIQLAAPCTLKARAYLSGYQPGTFTQVFFK